MTKSKVLLIYTGGTIGMKRNRETGALEPFDFDQLLTRMPELQELPVETASRQFDPPIDSSDMSPRLWTELAGIIANSYADYDGFVILHGTDTMAYSASALSFMLEGLTKPVIFTGSQLPIGVPRTDGKENLISAVEIAAAADEEGHALVPEVSIFFDSVLIRGNRATKLSAEAFNAFASPDCPPLAEAGIRIRYNRSVIRYPDDWSRPLKVHDRLDTRVAILKVHPGITPELVTVFLLAPEIRAVILETYGSGNAITRPWFLTLVREAGKTKAIVNVTQCKSGSVNMDIYATGRTLKLAGVVSGYDITTEAALGKLFVLLGENPDNEAVKNRFGEDLCGEISK